MAGPATTIIKSQTLATGEQFVLPPGAKLLGASDATLITSTCPIPPLETIGCFIGVIGSHDYNSEAYGFKTRIWCRGYRLNGVNTLFATELQNTDGDECYVMDHVGNALLAANIGILQYVEKHVQIDGTDQACVSMLLIQTVPSVANNLELLFRLNAEDTGNDTNTYPRIAFVPLADYPNVHKPDCPATLPTI